MLIGSGRSSPLRGWVVCSRSSSSRPVSACTRLAEREAAANAYFRKNAARWDEMRRLRVDDTEVERAVLDMLQARTKVGPAPADGT